MMDIQNNNAWTDWANYLLYIVKKHDGDIEKIEAELSDIGINIENLKQTKLNEEEFQNFLKNDYIVFKTEIKATEKKRTKIWGIILGIVAILSVVLQFIFKK